MTLACELWASMLLGLRLKVVFTRFGLTQVGSGKHQLEVPMAAVDALYAKVDTSVELHNRDFNPLHWKDFFALK